MRGSPTQHGQQKLEALRASCFEVIRTSIVSATANYDKNCVAMHTKSPNPSCRVAWGSLFGGCVINGHARHANRTTPLIFGLVELFQIPRISKHSKKTLHHGDLEGLPNHEPSTATPTPKLVLCVESKLHAT